MCISVTFSCFGLKYEQIAYFKFDLHLADTALAEKWSTRTMPSPETSNDPPGSSGLNV